MKKKINVGILFGGRSVEHEVSLLSAKNVVEALDKNKYNPILMGIDKQGRWHLNEASRVLLHAHDPKLIKLNLAKPHRVAMIPQGSGKLVSLAGKHKALSSVDVVFPILHGQFGEDGTIQGLLKLAHIPFVGAGVLGSAIGMDKDVMKRLLRDAGIPVCPFLTFCADDRPDFEKLSIKLGLPLFVKPANTGSSVGISKVNSPAELKKAVKLAFDFDTKILIEAFVPGREIECAVLGNDNPIASIPGEIIPHQKHGFYSYAAKYLDETGALLKIPAELPKAIVRKIQTLAVKTFKALECSGMARVDFFLKKNGDVFVNEINTIPGFTSISMYPQLWKESGINYSDLLDKLIELAFEKFQKEKNLKVSYSN